MHEMWCGPDTSGQRVWHILTTDKTGTLCGAERQEDPRRQDPTDKHCLPCMTTFQAVVQTR
ncbi:hypothetical protein [Streptomyces sp. NPDC052701]|uniref:hypothetical protein n=1 Tax=Streptomyces sp. NPDC052701 TaxID=3155533 RepID=UPI003424B30F